MPSKQRSRIRAARPGVVMCERGKGAALERRYVMRRYASELNFRGWSIWVPCCGGWRLFAAPFAELRALSKEATP